MTSPDFAEIRKRLAPEVGEMAILQAADEVLCTAKAVDELRRRLGADVSFIADVGDYGYALSVGVEIPPLLDYGRWRYAWHVLFDGALVASHGSQEALCLDILAAYRRGRSQTKADGAK